MSVIIIGGGEKANAAIERAVRLSVRMKPYQVAMCENAMQAMVQMLTLVSDEVELTK